MKPKVFIVGDPHKEREFTESIVHFLFEMVLLCDILYCLVVKIASSAMFGEILSYLDM